MKIKKSLKPKKVVNPKGRVVVVPEYLLPTLIKEDREVIKTECTTFVEQEVSGKGKKDK